MLTALLPLLTPRPLTVLGALTPPVCYYLALVLLPSFSPQAHQSSEYAKKKAISLVFSFVICALRSTLAFWSFLAFFTLPFRYYIPSSSAVTYQLGLIGWYGAGRVFELFLLTPLLPLRLPARMRYQSDSPLVSPVDRTFKDMDSEPSPEEAVRPVGWWERAVWALDLMVSMRGVGWDWATADVRHTPSRWHPNPSTQLYRLLTTLLPVLFLSIAGLRYFHPGHFESIYNLPLLEQAGLVACLGIALYSFFDVGYTIFALMVGLIIPHTYLDTRKTVYNSLLSFPPLYARPLTDVCSLRDWWSLGWHRLFARYFLVYGVWPGQIIALNINRLAPNGKPHPASPKSKLTYPYFSPYHYPRRTTTLSPTRAGGEWGKILGAFVISGVVHTVGERAALARFTRSARGVGGEFWFFVLNGVGVLVEEGVRRAVYSYRLRGEKGREGCGRSYDKYVGKMWTIGVLLATGTLFADGWVRSGIIWEMTGGDIWTRLCNL